MSSDPVIQVPARSWRERVLAGFPAGTELPVSLVDQALVSGSNFLLTALLARYLGIQGYGVFVLASTAVLFVSGIQQALIVAPFMTLWNSRSSGEKQQYESLVLVQQLVFAFAAAALIGLGATAWAAFDPQWGVVARIAKPLAGFVAAFLLQDFLRRAFFTRGEPLRALGLDAVAYGGQCLIVVCAGQLGLLTVESAYLALGGAFLLSTVLGLARVRLQGVGLRGLCSNVAEHWRFSKWMVGAALLQWSSGNYFLIAAGAVLGAAASGAIRAAQNIMGVTHVVFLALENVLPGRMAKILAQDGKPALRRFAKRAILAVTGFSLVISALVSIAPGWLLQLVYGERLRGYGFVLLWFAGLYPLIALNTVLRHVLRAASVTRPFFLSYVVSSGLSLVLAFPMVRALGVSGAMLGLLTTQVVGCGYVLVCVRTVLR